MTDSRPLEFMDISIKTEIIFVDDESFVLDGIRRGLCYIVEWDILYFNSSALALQHVESRVNENLPVNVVVTDLKMPTMDGIDLIKSIKKFKECHNTQFIILTGTRTQSDIFEEFGTDVEFLIKPVSKELLIFTIKKLLRYRVAREKPRSP